MAAPRKVWQDPCIDVDIHTQTSGTCWFHSMINPFILSQRLRPYLYKAIAVYINAFHDKEHLKDWLKPEAPSCISPGKQYSRVFALKKMWGILYHFPRPVYRTNRPPSTTSQNNIKNLLGGYFRTRASGANWADYMTRYIDHFLKRVGYTNYSLYEGNTLVTEKGPPGKKDFIVIMDGPHPAPKNQTFQGHRYKLESGGIHLGGNNKFAGATKHVSHGITGFKCKTNGEFMIYDSNMTMSYKCDWSNPANVLATRNYQNQTNITYRGNNRVAENERAKWTSCALNFVIYVPDDANNKDPAYQAYIHDEYKISPEQIRRKAASNAPQPGVATNNAARRNVNAAAGNPNLNARITNLRAKLRTATNETLKTRIRNHLQSALNTRAQRNASARQLNNAYSEAMKKATNKSQRNTAFRERFSVNSWTNAELKLAKKAIILGGGAGLNMVKNQRPNVRNAVKNALNRVPVRVVTS